MFLFYSLNSGLMFKNVNFLIKQAILLLMVKCKICNDKIAELFLNKLKGTIVKKAGTNKQHPICFSCQKKFKTKEEILEQIK